MHISFRGSAFGLVAAMAIAAAYAAWHPSAPARSARFAAHQYCRGGRPALSPAGKSDLRLHQLREQVGAGSAGICLACGDATDFSLSEFEQSTPAFIASRIEPFGLDLGDENPACTLQVSSLMRSLLRPAGCRTAAMVTLGLAAVGWAARKTRRALLEPRAEPGAQPLPPWRKPHSPRVC